MYYDESGNPIDSPDLTCGYVYRHHSLDGSVRQIYHAYTEEELASIAAAAARKTTAARVEALEAAGLERDAALMELAELIAGGIANG